MVLILTHCGCNALVKARSFPAYGVVVFLSLFFSCSVYSEAVSFEEDIFQPGLSDFETGDYQSAIERLEAAIGSVSGCQEVVLTKAAAGDGLDAIEALLSQSDDNNCGSVNSENLWNAHFYLVLSYLKLDNRLRALEEVEKAKSVDADKRPDSNIFSEDIVNLFDAAPETTVVLVEESWVSELQRGISEYEGGDYQRAIDRLEVAIGSVSGCQEVVLTKTATGDSLGALEDLFSQPDDNNCSSVNSENLWNAHFYLVLSYLKLDNLSRALEEVEKAKSLDADKRPDSTIFSEDIVSLFDVASETTVVLVEESWVSELQRGINEYESGDYGIALITLLGVINEIPHDKKNDCLDLSDPEEMMKCNNEEGLVRGYKDNSLWNAQFYIANSYFLNGNECTAIRKFEEAKLVDSISKPDALVFSPKVVGLYESNLSEMYKIRCDPAIQDPPTPIGEPRWWKSPWFWAGVAAVAGLAGSSGGGSSGESDPVPPSSSGETVVVSW